MSANTEKILARLNAILATDAAQSFDAVRPAIISLRDDVQAQLRNEVASSCRNVSPVKTAAAILKSQLNSRKALAYPWIDGNGRQCICDGIVAFRLNEHLPLPERPDNWGDGIDLDRVYDSAVHDGMKELALPSFAEVKAAIATQRAKYTGKRRNFEPIWDFGPDAPTVNAQYLLNVMTVMKNATKAFWSTLVSPMYFVGTNGDAILCPIRVAEKLAAKPAKPAEQPVTSAAERTARESIDAAIAKVNASVKAQKALMIKRKKATSSGIIAEIDAKLIELGKTEAREFLRAHALELAMNKDAAIEFDVFDAMVRKLNGCYPIPA